MRKVVILLGIGFFLALCECKNALAVNCAGVPMLKRSQSVCGPKWLIIGSSKMATRALYGIFEKQSSNRVKHVLAHDAVRLDIVNNVDTCVLLDTRYRGSPIRMSYHNSEDYWNRFDPKPQCEISSDIIGESCRNYLENPVAAKRAYCWFGADLKVIAVLRNPVERLITGHTFFAPDTVFNKYHFMKLWNETKEKMPDCARVWKGSTFLNPSVELPAVVTHCASHITKGLYAMQLRPWIQTFGKKNVFAITMERLETDTESVIREIFEFLGAGEDTPNYFSIPNELKTSLSRADKNYVPLKEAENFYKNENKNLDRMLRGGSVPWW
eukprot:TRINITY_DN3707_c0_g1_i1.p1 TRINITY_DN3707_c0_g1~~TRINITY_DN3707_c0_g1_i1.p1  ORF type:complete len:326 (+),score=27.84 TRINITY_DN3707_c0_g1_i1:132-1109(+)